MLPFKGIHILIGVDAQLPTPPHPTTTMCFGDILFICDGNFVGCSTCHESYPSFSLNCKGKER